MSDKMPLSEIRRILERGEWWDNVRDVSPDEPCPWLDELNGAIEAALDRLTEYKTAEKDGRLVEFPCKAGDPIYSCWSWCVPRKTHERNGILIGEYIVLLTGMMYTRKGEVTPFVCFGNGWGGICFEKPLDEVLEKCAFTLDGAFEQAEAALKGGGV